MRAGDDAFEQLRQAIDALAEAEAGDLVAEARIEARSKVRSILAEAMAQALLERAQTELSPEAFPTAPPPARSPAAPVARQQGGAPAGETSDPKRARHAAAPPMSETPKADVAGPTGELGWYVYCVVGGEALALDDLPGVDGAHPVTVLRGEGLGAVASQVPLDEFGEDTLRESLNDVTWLEDTARAHERVLDHVRERTTVIPMRLCTIYRTDLSVREMLMREATALTEALQRLAGRTEWGVKVFGETAAIVQAAEEHSAALADLAAEVSRASPGEAYMLRKRLEELRGEEVDHLIEEHGDAIHARLSAAAVDALLNPLQPREVTNHDGEMLFNGVYLVDDASSENFHGTLAGLRDEYRKFGFEFALTGPWPPYNFVKGTIEAAW
jgi:hypothetical protein